MPRKSGEDDRKVAEAEAFKSGIRLLRGWACVLCLLEGIQEHVLRGGQAAFSKT